jgi:hypothetical protein
MNRGNRLVAAGLALGLMASTASATTPTEPVSTEARARIEALVGKSGGKVNYFQGPSGTVGVGVTMQNGKQLVLYATADGRVLFSGVAVDTSRARTSRDGTSRRGCRSRTCREC